MKNDILQGLTEAQRSAVLSNEKIVGVDASAGSGKTRVLISRILRILSDPDPAYRAELNEIVAITFTNKAASEMKQRLKEAFHSMPSETSPEELSLWRWREQLLENASICTIHSFCANILRRYAIKFGIDPEFTIADGVMNTILLNSFLTEYLTQQIEQQNPLIEELAIEFSYGGIFKILSELLQKPIFVLSFLEKITTQQSDWKNQPQAVIKTMKDLLNAEYYHHTIKVFSKSPLIHIFIKLLQQFEGWIENPNNYIEKRRAFLIQTLEKIVSTEDEQNLLSLYESITNLTSVIKGRLNARDGEDKTKIEMLRKEIIEKIKGFFQEIFLSGDAYSDDDTNLKITYKVLQVFEHCNQQWEEFKQKYSVVNFDDLIYRTRTLLQRHPEICKEIGNGIKHILIDEFQDTDREQVELIQVLISNCPHIYFFFVGDAKQSIYLFRGAEVKVFQQYRRHAQHLVQLQNNFRSAPEILQFINDLFSGTEILYEVEHPYKIMHSDRQHYKEPRVEFLICSHPQQALDTKKEIVTAEANRIAERILQLTSGPNPLHIRDKKTNVMRPVQFGDFALLFRSTTYIYLYEKSLKNRNVPCQVISGRGFFEVREVKDLLQFLLVLINPYHDPSVLAFLRGPFSALSDEDILRWRIVCTGMSHPLTELLLSNVEIPSTLPNVEHYQRIRLLYQSFTNRLHLPLHELLEQIIEMTGYEAILLSQPFGEQKVANIQKFIALTRSYYSKQVVNIHNYVTLIDKLKSYILEGEADLEVERQNTVTLTTVHKAKGLEFPVVIIPDLGSSQSSEYSIVDHELGVLCQLDAWTRPKTKDKKPNRWEKIFSLKQRLESDQEFIRLLYVALTRTQDYLILPVNQSCLTRTVSKNFTWFDVLNSYYSIPKQATEVDENSLFKVVAYAPTTETSKELQPTTKQYTERYVKPIYIDIERASDTPISVSRLLHFMVDDTASTDYEIDEYYEVYQDEANPADRGSLIHTILRWWDFQTNTCPSRDSIRIHFENNCSQFNTEWIDKEIRIFCEELVKHSAYHILKENPPVVRELPFLWNVNHTLIQGTIDAVLKQGTLVDYKTGKNASNYLDRYWRQLELYYFALQDLGMELNGDLMLILLDENKFLVKSIEEVSKESVLDSIHRALARCIQQMNTYCR